MTYFHDFFKFKFNLPSARHVFAQSSKMFLSWDNWIFFSFESIIIFCIETVALQLQASVQLIFFYESQFNYHLLQKQIKCVCVMLIKQQMKGVNHLLRHTVCGQLYL